MEHQSAVLLRRLNPYCAQALEAAASLCQTRAHSEITLEHWLLKLLEQGEGDITVLARRYEWNMDELWQSLLSHLDRLPRSIHSRPKLAQDLQTLMKAAWLVASLQNDNATIRSIHLLEALKSQPALLRCEGLWPLSSLSETQINRLKPMLDAQSDERPELQLQESLSQMPSSLDEAKRHGAGISGTSLSEALQVTLDKFTLDVTAKAREGKIDPVFGRENEIRQMVDILSRRRKNNPILVGEPGVGKTALVEGLALRIAEGNVPGSLKTVSVRTLDLGLLQAGAGVKGEFEQRLKNVIEAVQQSPAPVLLFIDEAHTIIGAGNQAGGADAANLLKPALARGELRTIAATTWSEYKQYFERDAALERRFQRVIVDEPDDETACLMLRGLKSRYAWHHGVHITDDAVKAAVSLSRRYITGRQLPDKAVDLLDTASARVRMSLDTLPEVLTQLKVQMSALEMEKQALLEDIALGGITHGDRLMHIEQHNTNLTAELQLRQNQFILEKELTQQLLNCRGDISRQADISALLAKLRVVQMGAPLMSLDVDVRTVAAVIADWTGVPLSSLMKDEQNELLQLEANLAKYVVGQDSALYALAQRLRAAKTGLTPENGPLGVFLFMHNVATRLENKDGSHSGNSAVVLPADSVGSGAPKSAAHSEPLVYVVCEESATPRVVTVQTTRYHRRTFAAGMLTMLLVGSAGWWGWQKINPAISAPVPMVANEMSLTTLGQFSPVWRQNYGFVLASRAESAEAEKLKARWQQYINANALPYEALSDWHQGMEGLQDLTRRLNALDERKGKYLTGSELKSMVFAITQNFGRTVPVEEQLYQLSQIESGIPLPATLLLKTDLHFNQLLNRYALIQQQANTP